MDDFEEFAQARATPLLRSAWLLCGDLHEAEDLVQETLTKVYVRWHRPFGRPIDNPAAYAQTTLVRTFISSRRRRSALERPIADPPESAAPDTAGAADLRLVRGQALAQLSTRDRALLVLRYQEDRSVREVAEVLKCSEAAVKTGTRRALERLRPHLDTHQLAPGGTP